MNEVLKICLSTEGRLNRLRYFQYGLVLGLISAVISFGLHMLFGTEGFMATAIDAVIGLLWFMCYISLVIRRLHDLDKGGVWAILTLIPIVNFFFGIYLLFFKGTDGYNQYGEDPLTYR